jgi:N-acetylneuraminate synthase/N,N'-diacetyllegionaminate synthase
MNDRHTLIIAEAGVNHNGSMDLAKHLIDVAAAAGADFIKFQTFKADKLVSLAAAKATYQQNNFPDADAYQYQMLKKLELDVEKHKELIRYAGQKKIKFLSTAFDLDSVDMLNELGITHFKIPSGEITNLPLIEKIGRLGKPVILSTGMSNIGEIEQAIDVLYATGLSRNQITVLHCNTQYPTPMQDVNLRAMQTIAQTFGVKAGYSDHTLGIEVPIAAVAMGATIIEKHFTTDRNLPGPDHRASLEPEELKQMVTSIRNIEKALGSSIKQPSASEKPNIELARKSIHLANDKKKEEAIALEDMIMLRPGDGISPMQYKLVVGRRITDDLPAGHKLHWKDLK